MPVWLSFGWKLLSFCIFANLPSYYLFWPCMPYVSCLQVFLCLYLPRDWWILSLFVSEGHVYLELWKCLVLIDSIFLLYLYYSYCLYWCHMWFYCLAEWYLILSHQCSLFSIDRCFVLFAYYAYIQCVVICQNNVMIRQPW